MRLTLTICILLFFTTCRKKSDISITAWNYALAEPIANAEVIIVESKFEGGLFSASSTCKEVAKAITDGNGRCFFKVQTNNLLNPSQPDDSLIVGITSPKYEVPGQPYPFGGGGIFFSGPYYGANGFPYPTTLFSEVKPTNAGKNVLYIRKRKLGIVTQTIDTIKIYPYETKLIEINW